MQPLVIIPARFASVRFPGKPLAALTARDGVSRPLIEWTWRAAVAAVDEGQVVVATDDARIADAADRFGARWVMTDPTLRNGTERCAAAFAALSDRADVIVNLQGDSPLVPTAHVAALLQRMSDPTVAVATPFVTCDPTMMGWIEAEQNEGRVGGTCVVARHDGTAAYFSKRAIPFGASPDFPLKLHLGVYAYRPESLAAYAAMPPSPLERAEGLEQLRYVEAAIPVHLVEVQRPQGGIWEVNNPDDIAKVNALLAS
ncbi:3-deoxy-manno-octulosonate cytidylyltransferase (CMP-KDO synthetase) [Novosphingobium kunmingense]|uniref:3-deoxy-manno-octulosonate cytidylyltransferase (CMP-KDO synthetase) n=1 Tax=Novosphingobium kunmingense TaxID=1211806 RepID=A0A2N0HJ96_9SPHN|nr:3-deoxy-manno-octulosonate cytidylyltransferase [Novosphingobium kunmingense]PKB19012.1 3-deoxy-manno-octulosonate cytidylyltransferase (CMP-KDO synthetase) [Novosphingobium kunmingense]